MGNFYWADFGSIWNHFDSALADWDRFVVQPKKQLSCLPAYPHSDCWLDDGADNLWLRFAFSLNIDEAFELSKAETDFSNGLLTIKIPRTEDAKIVSLF